MTTDLRDRPDFIDLSDEDLKEMVSLQRSGQTPLKIKGPPPIPVVTFLMRKDFRIDAASIKFIKENEHHYQWYLAGFIKLSEGAVVGHFKLTQDTNVKVYEGTFYTRKLVDDKSLKK